MDFNRVKKAIENEFYKRFKKVPKKDLKRILKSKKRLWKEHNKIVEIEETDRLREPEDIAFLR